MINQILNNRYKITALLGEGAMGEVYRATDTQTGQEVAVKVITQKLAFDEDMLARFRREGESLRHLRHANIVAFVDMFAIGKQQAIVMEYVPGGSLHSLVKRGALPIHHAVRIALELSDALAQAHHINIIHRDLKPENVLMSEEGRPKLTDFGVARLLSETQRLTGTGTQVGTPYYMCPEAWEGKKLDEQSDIWSLGVVLFEMITGKVPFTGDTLVAVMNRVLTTPPPDLRTLRPDVPPALVKIIQRMLTRDKAKRYASMREVALDLERVAKGDGSRPKEEAPRLREGKRPAEDRQPPQTARKRPGQMVWVVAVIVGLLFIGSLAAVGGLGLWMVNSANVASQATQTALVAELRSTQAALAVTPSETPQLNLTSLALTETPRITATLELATPTAVSSLAIGSRLVSERDGMMQLYVPAGDFLMGAADADNEAANDERPQHTVYLDGYWIDQTGVTNAMYAQCVKTGRCQPPSETSSASRNDYYINPQYAPYPVIYVSWDDAKAYCEWAGRRLPTEAEWEKAARGTDGRIYPWGNQTPGQTLLNFNQLTGDTTAVGYFPAGGSPYGALDMAGNVWQWTADWYSDTYYASSPDRNPTGANSGQYRVLRGGAWNSEGVLIRATYRTKLRPYSRSETSGFRCAATP
jgi:eukaryotic-like serine/threonine-protein kinase